MQEENFDAGIHQLEDHGYIHLNGSMWMSSETGLVHQAMTVPDLVALIVVSTLRIEDMRTMELEVAV